MQISTWEDVKALIGEELSLFTIYMSSLEASDILEGFVKVAKGSQYLSTQTLDAMYQEMLAGIARESLYQKTGCSSIAEDLPESVFRTGLQDLMDWIDMTSSRQAEDYFGYLTHWDLDGHDWIHEKPKTFGQFSGIQLES